MANEEAKNLIADRLSGLTDRPDLLDEQNYVRHAAPLINDADEGIAYIVMREADRQNVRLAIKLLAREVVGRMGLATLSRYRA